MLDIMQIGRNLASLRQSLGFTTEDIAKKQNVSQIEVLDWEKGNALPNIPSLILFLEIYQTSIDELLCLSDLETDTAYHKLFAEHDHMFLVREIICGQLKKIAFFDVIHFLSKEERDYALFLHINHNISIESRLWTRLSVEERMRLLIAYLDKNYALPLYDWCMDLSYAERKKIKEKKNEYYENVAFSRNRRFGRISRTICHQRNH